MFNRTTKIAVCQCVAIALVFLVAVGCDDVRRHQATDAVTVAEVAPPVPFDASPNEVATALLDSIRQAQQARMGGLGTQEKRTRYDEALSRIWSLASKETIHATLTQSRTPGVPLGISQEAALTTISESWISMLAYYIDGVVPETVMNIPGHDATSTIVRVEAVNPFDAKQLKELDARPEIAEAKDAKSRPIEKGTKAYYELTRPLAIGSERPFNVPIETKIEIHMKQIEGSWKAWRIVIGPSPRRPHAPSVPSSPSTSS